MRAAGWWAAVLGGLLAADRPAVGQPLAPPPAWSDYFGPADTQPFSPSTVFPNPPKKRSPEFLPPPVLPGDPEPADDHKPGPEADGGLLSRLHLPIPLPPKPWSGGIDFGLTGATGNTELLTLRGGWNLRRKTDTNAFVSDLLYTYSAEDGATNANQALFNARDEILFPGKPWSVFAANQVEYDELRLYRFRVGAYAGIGYTLVDNPHRTLKGRFGAGATRELGVGGPQDQWVPELVVGYDFRYRVNDRSAFLSVGDVYPRVDRDFGQVRVRVRAAYELVLDPDTGTCLRFGLQNRYDSNPGTGTNQQSDRRAIEANDLTYFTTLGIRF